MRMDKCTVSGEFLDIVHRHFLLLKETYSECMFYSEEQPLSRELCRVFKRYGYDDSTYFFNTIHDLIQYIIDGGEANNGKGLDQV